ncbi:MAG: cadmium-translocating P-type ATPase [Chloroflexi bacterium]|nr:cadmium-translocating P-type ATPase [Chloroflexota bacterium]
MSEKEREYKEKEQERKYLGGPWWRYPNLRNALIAGILLAAGFGLGHLGLIPVWAERSLYAVAIAVGAYYWGREGLEELVKEREVGIEILMAAATVGAVILGEWDEAAFLVFLYAAAEGVEHYTYHRTRSAIRALMDLAPKEAVALRNGQEIVVPAQELAPGDVFLVRPGESLATDGLVLEGTSSVDESPVTGESIPVEKAVGSQVFAGSINKQGALKVKATRSFEDNTLSRIIHLVEEAQEQKSRAQLFIERFGRRYSPAVLGGAVLLLALPPLFGAEFQVWAIRAVVLLVAAAPCALVMSTPVAVAAAIGRAGRSGVLIKGGQYLEALGTARVVAFDKTGTLTLGKPQVTDVLAFNQASPEEVLTMAASVERFSEHPLARAIVEQAQVRKLKLKEAQRSEALTGAGARAKVDGQELYVGSPALFGKACLVDASISATVDRLQTEGRTVVLVGPQDCPAGIIGLQDEARPGAAEAVSALRRLGIVKLVMLTGDNRRTAEAIGTELDINEVYAELKPEDKVRVVRELEKRFGRVVMVGDGVNDAPALAASSAGIAMGAIGTDAAIEAADVALMADDLDKVAYAIRVGRKAQGVSRQNIAFSLLLLAVLIPSAVLGFIGVALAVLAHEGAELLAISNGLRAGRV